MRRIREELPQDYVAISNFEIPAGRRDFECDAVIFSPGGWAYVVETKWLFGQVTGNDKQWSMPHQFTDERRYVDNPIYLLKRKLKKLSSRLKDSDARLVDIRLFPLIVVVSNLEPRIQGARRPPS